MQVNADYREKWRLPQSFLQKHLAGRKMHEKQFAVFLFCNVYGLND